MFVVSVPGDVFHFSIAYGYCCFQLTFPHALNPVSCYLFDFAVCLGLPLIWDEIRVGIIGSWHYERFNVDHRQPVRVAVTGILVPLLSKRIGAFVLEFVAG